MPKRHIIIGDVHGCLHELNALLNQVGPEAGDDLVFVGDLLDKGPHPIQVVQRVRQYAEQTRVNVVLVEGNHENKHRRYREHEKRRLETGKHNPIRDPDGTLKEALEGLSPADVEFLDNAVLFHRIPEHDVLVVHGGVPPAVTELPVGSVRSADLRGKEKAHLTTLLRTRFVDLDTGKMVSMDDVDRAKHPYWTDVYDGRFGHVVYGHEPHLDHYTPSMYPYATGIDLGCVHGGHLCALIFHEGETRALAVTVRALDTYSEARWAE